jgi:N-acetylmuramoyl-L-alanine amidase
MSKEYVMLHHSLTKDGPLLNWGAIERYHVITKGWADVAYHYGVELVDDRFYTVVGRPEHHKAAACYQAEMNDKAIHVCLVGNFDEVTPPYWMTATLIKRVLLPVMYRYNIPVERIVGHSEYAPYKSCPGRLLNLAALRDKVRKELQ